MEAADEVASNVVKGKRTKRHRVQSPIPIAFTSGAGENIDAIGENADDNGKFTDGNGENTDENRKFTDRIGKNTDENRKFTDGNGENTHGNGKLTDGMLAITDGIGENGNGKNAEMISVGDVNDLINAENSTNVSPTSSQELIQSQGTTEEEDVANCLILLAQGDPVIHSIVPISTGTKFNSRKFMETSGTGGSGKGGYYVYECKTCCRTFPSFQALGGHRASHKKPKGMINNYNYNYNDEKKLANSSEEELDVHYKDFSSLSLQLNNTNTSIINKSKIHECSICGAEFASGQALGGHMRRHRAPTNTNPKNLSLAPMAIEPSQPSKQKNVVSLDLDLNLPAPDVEDKQNHLNQQQKSPLVLPGPALVDCHY